MNPILKGLRGTVAAVVVAGLVQSVGSMALGPLADASNSALTATTAVNIRAAATTNSARLGILFRGERIQAVGASNGWTKVSFKGRTGYVASAYLSSSSTGTQNRRRLRQQVMSTPPPTSTCALGRACPALSRESQPPAPNSVSPAPSAVPTARCSTARGHCGRPRPTSPAQLVPPRSPCQPPPAG